MPIKVFRRKGSLIYSYAGTVAGRRLRGSTKTSDKIRAERIAAKVESEEWKRTLDGPQSVLTFAKAVILYRAAGKVSVKEQRYFVRLEDHWKNTLVKEMTRGAIKQSAIDLYPGRSGATWNRQIITPTQAVINHCADLELCSPVRIERFDFEQQIKQPMTLDWLDTFCAHARPIVDALATLIFATGCRISDARRLDWPQIDFQRRAILIQKTKAKKQRFAHMPQRLLIALANLPRDTMPFGIPESTLRAWWDADIEATAKAAPGFDRLTFHCGRHGATTRLLHEGVDVVTVGKLVGMTPEQVMRTYGHAKDDPTLTDKLFDTELTQPTAVSSKINRIE